MKSRGWEKGRIMGMAAFRYISSLEGGKIIDFSQRDEESAALSWA